MYVTETVGTTWNLTRPKATENTSIESAMNSIAKHLLLEMDIQCKGIKGFSEWWRINHGNLLPLIEQRIGRTFTVELEDEKSPRIWRYENGKKNGSEKYE